MTNPTPKTPPDREAVRSYARTLGFDVVRFAKAESSQKSRDGFAEFLAQGFDGDMGWLRANADRRADPKVLWPEARSVIMVGVNYGPDHDPRAALAATETGTISVYARNRDYHDTLKKRLKHLAMWLAETASTDVKIFVDTAPVLEKPLAQAAGLGWQGKHTNVVSRDFGSWLFLGEVFTALEIEPDAPETDHCGACHACLDICPTKAFVGPYKLDARRCISYLTIEHKGHIDRALRPLMGNRIYGCDDCLSVCPWNKFARVVQEPDFLPRPQLVGPKLADLAALDDAAFRTLFAGSPIKRIGRNRFVRNVLIAIGNSGDLKLANAAQQRLNDESPLVRAAAVWVVRRLMAEKEIARLREGHLATEADDEVRTEWTAEVNSTSALPTP